MEASAQVTKENEFSLSDFDAKVQELKDLRLRLKAAIPLKVEKNRATCEAKKFYEAEKGKAAADALLEQARLEVDQARGAFNAVESDLSCLISNGRKRCLELLAADWSPIYTELIVLGIEGLENSEQLFERARARIAAQNAPRETFNKIVAGAGADTQQIPASEVAGVETLKQLPSLKGAIEQARHAVGQHGNPEERK